LLQRADAGEDGSRVYLMEPWTDYVPDLLQVRDVVAKPPRRPVSPPPPWPAQAIANAPRP